MREDAVSAFRYKVAHRIYILTLAGKGLIGLLQLATAAAIHFQTVERLPALAQSIFAAELAEDPNDFLAARIIGLAGTMPTSDLAFYSLYFAAHGVLHIAIVAALLVGTIWAYPAAIAMLVAFILYQVVEWMSVGGPTLLILSAIDLVVIYLTVLEWRHRRVAKGRY
ncbi:MAG: DUF2127 domain-containing protein [Silicimonas sp.]|nr:DUF2127 domain-containing protein [Silicimonas sp.]